MLIYLLCQRAPMTNTYVFMCEFNTRDMQTTILIVNYSVNYVILNWQLLNARSDVTIKSHKIFTFYGLTSRDLRDVVASGTFEQREIVGNLKYSYPRRFFIARPSEDEAINVLIHQSVPRSQINTGCPLI